MLLLFFIVLLFCVFCVLASLSFYVCAFPVSGLLADLHHYHVSELTKCPFAWSYLCWVSRIRKC